MFYFFFSSLNRDKTKLWKGYLISIFYEQLYHSQDSKVLNIEFLEIT